MRITPFRTAFLLLSFSIVAGHSAPIQNLTFTEVIKDVFVIDPGTKKETPAKTGDKLVPPNVLKTGADSRAELVADDKTVTRVGSNTIFSVEANSRDVNLTQGSVLFHSPAGRGGGRIKSAGATASVLGTTLAVSANSDGGFKTSLLEGKGEVKDPKGGKVGLVAGQVTFAKPGGGLSPALNFDLRAQISSSKLVGGFSSPLASIAKIEAAVAVQQAKISGGALANTGLLIGDRPDAAFDVDSTIVDRQVNLAKARRIDQINAAKETKTFYEVDPRFIKSIVKTVHLSLDPANKLTELGDTLPANYFFLQDQTAPETNVFIIDRTGRASLEPEIPNAIGGVPANLPSSPTSRLDSSVTYHALIANEIILNLAPPQLKTLQNASIQTSGIGTETQETRLTIAEGQLLPEWLKPGVLLTGNNLLPGTIVSSVQNNVALLNQSPLANITSGEIKGVEVPQFFLPIPLIEKVGGAMVARQNLDFTGAIEFVGIDNIETTPDGYETGQTLLLSAGRTIKITPGSMLVANTSLFEIYTGGSSFSADLSLALTPLGANESPVPLKLDRVALINKFPLDSASNSSGKIWITAPEIHLTDTLILAASKSEATEIPPEGKNYQVFLQSAGNISLLTNAGTGADGGLTEATSKLLVTLGFTNVKDLCIKAFSVGIRSESKTVSLNGISLYTNDVTLFGGDELKLTSVVIDPFDFQREQTLTAEALNSVNINSGATLGEDRTRLIPAAISSLIESKNAGVTIENTEFGSPSDPASDTAPKTAFTATALKGAILLTASAINADTVLFNGKLVTFEGVTIAPTDSDKGTIKVNSATDLNVSVKTNARASSFKAYEIVLDAKNNMTLNNLAVDHVNRSSANTFSATAVGQLEMARVGLSYAQTVALDAHTIVLENVSFKAGSNVTMTSHEGILSTPASIEGITKGWVNILPKGKGQIDGGVMYGLHDLHDLSTQTKNYPNGGIPAKDFQKAVFAQFGTGLENLNLRKK